MDLKLYPKIKPSMYAIIPTGINVMVADDGLNNFLAGGQAKSTATNVSHQAIILKSKGHLASIKMCL